MPANQPKPASPAPTVPRAIGKTRPLAALATKDEPGTWLARRWGTRAGIDPDLLLQLDL
jgi:hypothetical protein